MVAIIKTGHSIRSIFNYNENKVSSGKAICIGEKNYPMDIENLSATFKLNFLQKQLELNDNVKRNSVHISLNFDPSENYPKEKLMGIANTYMEKIGFGEQPYLVYQHFDSGHPHIHIISIKVKADGKRIDMQNIGRNQSEVARKEIEKSFGLVVAQGKRTKINFELKPIVAAYGKTQSKKAINEVLNFVINSYKYSSLAELNAILGLYNVKADRGSEDSRVYKNNGLIYHILDQKGNPIGVSIKASDFYSKPTLKFLERKFIMNKARMVNDSKRVKNIINLAFLKDKPTLKQLIKILEKEGISTVLRTSSTGLIYGITYIDHTSQCVINGSTLGKEFAAKSILERCEMKSQTIMKPNTIPQRKHSPSFMPASDLQKIINDVLQPEFVQNYIPNQLKKKRRKRRGQSNNL